MGVEIANVSPLDVVSGIDDHRHLIQEPRIDSTCLMDSLAVDTTANTLGHQEQPLRRRHRHCLDQLVVGHRAHRHLGRIPVQSQASGLQ